MAVMTTPVAELPTTLTEAHALILALAEERAAIEAENSRIATEIATLTAVNQTADTRIAELTAIVKMIERTLYGTRSERLRSERPSDEQIGFVFDKIATRVAAVEAELAKAIGTDSTQRAPWFRRQRC